jgi:hypothetical protein
MSEQNAGSAPVEAQVESPQVEESTEEVVEEGQEASSEAAPQKEITQAQADKVIKQAKDAGASKQELKQLREVLELKVNGKIIKKEVDWNDKESLKRELQLAMAGREAMAESSELKKLFANEIGRLKQDPWSVLEELGLNPDELAELRIQQRIEEMQKSPEQKERERLENEKIKYMQEVEALRKQIQQKEEKEKELARQKFEEEVAHDLEENIIKALDAHKDISASPKIINRIADTMLWAIDNGFEDVTPEDVIPTVRKELRTEINDLLANLPEDFLEEFIGQKTIDKLRKKRLAAAKQAKAVNNVSNVAPKTTNESPKEENKKKQKLEDFMRMF